MSTAILGLGFVLLSFLLLLYYLIRLRKGRQQPARNILAFSQLQHGIGRAVEAGERIHIALGHGGLLGPQGAPALIGLISLRRIARATSVSDKPPVATSGESTLSILSQEVLKDVLESMRAGSVYDPMSARVGGLTPFSYAAGSLPVIYDEQVAVNLVAGSFGSEVALLADAAERRGALTIGGSEDLTAQAVLMATADEPLVGEELFSAGAYLQAGSAHTASIQMQDFLRWVLILSILIGTMVKILGIM
jgi:hypothetical protein